MVVDMLVDMVVDMVEDMMIEMGKFIKFKNFDKKDVVEEIIFTN